MSDRIVGSGLLVAGLAIAALSVVALATMATPGAVEDPAAPSSPNATGSPVAVMPSSAVTIPPSPIPSSPPTATPTQAGAETPIPTRSQADVIAAFMSQLAGALRTGDAAFQVAHLHPDALARYGEAQCLEQLPNRADPTVAITVVSIGRPERWDYETDDLATTVDQTLPVTVDMTIEGVAARRVLHVTVEAGVVRWFTDCGLPVDTPAP